MIDDSSLRQDGLREALTRIIVCGTAIALFLARLLHFATLRDRRRLHARSFPYLVSSKSIARIRDNVTLRVDLTDLGLGTWDGRRERVRQKKASAAFQ